MKIEEALKLLSKLYECRDSCKKLWGKDWKKHIESETEIIKAAMKKYALNNELEAAIKIEKDIPDDANRDILVTKLFAAAVELIEPIEL